MKTLLAPVRGVLSLAMLIVLSATGSALACEKHLNGHQTGSDTSSEAANR